MRRGHAPTRERAQADIVAGRVLVNGAPAEKAARQVGADDAIVIQGEPPPFVSRGGEKLAAALDRFHVDPAGRHVLDAGASTGGFTDCVLQRGAVGVVAVDVGYGQLHERLRADPRVTAHDRTNIRHLAPDAIAGPFDLVVGDLSFISLKLVLGVLASHCRPGGELVLLVKPQFEAGRVEVSRGRGVVTDPAVWRAVLAGVLSSCGGHGITPVGLMVSPITGAAGNVEFLLHGRRAAPEEGPLPVDELAVLVDAAVSEAGRTGGG